MATTKAGARKVKGQEPKGLSVETRLTQLENDLEMLHACGMTRNERIAELKASLKEQADLAQSESDHRQECDEILAGRLDAEAQARLDLDVDLSDALCVLDGRVKALEEKLEAERNFRKQRDAHFFSDIGHQERQIEDQNDRLHRLWARLDRLSRLERPWPIRLWLWLFGGKS